MKCDDLRNLCLLARVSGILSAMAGMRGATITDTMSIELEDAAEKIVEVENFLFDKELRKTGLTIDIKGAPGAEEMIKYLNEKKVNVYDGRPTETFGRVYPAQEDAGDQ